MMLNQDTPRRRLAVDLSELEYAFEDASWEASRYTCTARHPWAVPGAKCRCLDLETGRAGYSDVITITGEIRREMQDLYEESDEQENGEPIDFAELVRRRDLPDWEKDAVIEADQVERGDGSRYIGVPEADPHEGYRDMEDFRHGQGRAPAKSPLASHPGSGRLSPVQRCVGRSRPQSDLLSCNRQRTQS